MDFHGNHTHGESAARIGGPTPEYMAWCAMKDRCFRTTHPAYGRYGGRGVVVCERWLSYENFLADMGRRPTPDHSLDRLDNAGHYEPGNCAWRTIEEQNNNKRNNFVVTLHGQKMTLMQSAKVLGMSRRAIRSRLLKGMTMEQIADERSKRPWKAMNKWA